MADDLFETFLNPPVAAIAPQGAAAQPAVDDLLSAFLPRDPVIPNSTVDVGGIPFPIGKEWDRQMAEQNARHAMNPPPFTGPITSPADALAAAKQTRNYVLDQARGIPGQIATDFTAGKALAGQGISETGAGNYLPTFPSANPKTWTAGGPLKTVAGALGMVGSPISAASEKLAGEPVTQLTGSPVAGQVANIAAGAAMANAIPLMMRGSPADAETLRLANVAQREGIPIRASQISQSPFIQKVDQAIGWIPGSGRASENAAQQAGFVRSASRNFGENTPQITRATIDNATRRIGGVLNDVENRTPITVDNNIMNRLGQIENEARDLFTPGTPQYNQVRSQIDQVMNVAAHHGGVVPGDVWAQFYHTNSPIDKLSKLNNSDVSQFGKDLKTAMRDAVQSQALPEDAAAYTNARLQYRNMKTIEPLVTRGTPGDISPSGLAQRVAQRFDTRSTGGLPDLADAAQRFLRKPSDSGTPLGMKVLAALEMPGQALAGVMAGQQLGLSPLAIAGAGVAAPAATAAIGRIASGLLNNPIYRNSLLRGGAADTPSIARQLILGSVPNMPVPKKPEPRQLER